MVWQLSGVWLCKRKWVCTICGAPQVRPNSSQTSYQLQSLYGGTCYWNSRLLSVEFFQFEVFAVVCVGPKWCYNIPISVWLKLWMHPSDWLALAVMVLICLSHFKVFWMVMPKYFAESALSIVRPCNWYVCKIVFHFVLHLLLCMSGWKCMSQSCSYLPAASRSCWSFIASSLFFICLYMMLSSANKRNMLCWMYSARPFMNMRNNIGPSTVPWCYRYFVICFSLKDNRLCSVCKKVFYPV
jgi:hypothetical protein